MASKGSAPAERRQALYSGHVQGVGFRFTVRRLAEEVDIVGFVRNLSDGRVELVAEGAGNELDRLLAAISERMGDYIDHIAVDHRPVTGEFSTFEIRH